MQSVSRHFFISLALGLPVLSLGLTAAPPAQTPLGVAHIGGLYSFTETDYLNERSLPQ